MGQKLSDYAASQGLDPSYAGEVLLTFASQAEAELGSVSYHTPNFILEDVGIQSKDDLETVIKKIRAAIACPDETARLCIEHWGEFENENDMEEKMKLLRSDLEVALDWLQAENF